MLLGWWYSDVTCTGVVISCAGVVIHARHNISDTWGTFLFDMLGISKYILLQIFIIKVG